MFSAFKVFFLTILIRDKVDPAVEPFAHFIQVQGRLLPHCGERSDDRGRGQDYGGFFIVQVYYV